MTTATEIGTVTEDVLKTLDFHIGIDTSGSTSKPSHRMPGKTRLQEMQEEAGRIIRAAGQYDNDGLTLTVFSTHVRTIDGVTPDRIDSVFAELESSGSTDLGGCIREFTKKALASTKPLVGFIFTDGEASNQPDVLQAVREAARTTKGRPKFGFVIVQTGNDVSATEYLRSLDADLQKYNIPDMIAVVTEDESEGLTFPNLAWLAQNA